MLEAELRESSNYINLSPEEKAVSGEQTAPDHDVMEKKEIDIVSGYSGGYIFYSSASMLDLC